MIDIYRAGAVVTSVHPSDSDKVTKKVMGENTLSLSFTLAAPFNFKVGDYLYFAGEKYTLNITPEVVKRSTTMFDYTLLFEGIEYELRKVRLLFATEAMGIGGGADFSLMGNAALFAQVIVANLNRIQTGWTVGSVISSETKNLTFSGDSCLTAINKVATEFSTEYWIGQDKTINIGKKGSILPVTFEYGLGNGLYSITRTNVSSKDIITRLYPFGSEQNLPKGYAGKRLQIDGDYIEANVDKYGIIESSQNFDDIKPERTGTITGLGADIFTFIDASMDFDINAKDTNGNTLYLVPGTTAKIHFQSGDLAGYEFELSSYDHATKAFKLIEFTNEIAYKLPNATLKPAIGDTYIILDIYMPQTYVEAAKARLLAKAQESLAQNSEPQLSYKVAVDPQFVADKGLTFASGDYVGIKDTQLLVDRNIRQVAVTRYLNNPNKYEFDLADTVEPSLTTQILTTLEATDIIIKQNKLADPARARRNWKTVEELRGAIYDVDGYFDAENIKPFSIETNMLTVGSKGNQFYLDCYFQANYGGVANNVVVGDGSLAHFTIEENIRTWSVTGLTATIPDNNLRYIYVSCLKVGNAAQVTLSATTKAIEDETHYYFLAGVISSVIDSARQISLLFGFTSINGRFIKTGRVQSADGNTYFDLDSGEIQGKITFKAGSSGYSQLTDKPDLTVFSEKTYVDAIKEDLQDQIDGVVDSWFYNYTPSVANAPASDWTTTEIKQRHVGDTFTNTQPFVDNATTPDAGKSWRWVNNSGVFSWTPIADSDAVKALLEASKAQDTADGKRRVFTAQPSAPYDAGDLWAKGTSIYKCDVAKVVGQAYSASDWSVTATDDTAVNNLQIGGRNLFPNSSFENGAHISLNDNVYLVSAPFDANITAINGSKVLFLSRTQEDTYAVFNPIKLAPNTEYTMSYWYISAGDITSHSSYSHLSLAPTAAAAAYVGTGQPEPLTNKIWKYHKFTFETTDTAIYFSFRFGWHSGSASWAALDCLKLEKGNKATDWTPAPEDVDAKINEVNYLKEALKNDTEIQGGLVSTTLLKVGAVNEAGTWVAKAFINGSGSGANTPRFATGGDVSEAIARIEGDKRRPMSVITEGGKAFLDSGEIGGFNITDSGIEKEQVITDSDGVEYTGKVMLDWLNQRINFLRDSASKVLLSAKKLTTGIPSPANSSVAAGSWQTEVDVSAVTSYTSSLAPRVVLQPGGYNCAYGFNVRVVAPSPPPNYSYTVYVSYNVTVRVWITDANNNKISLLSSATTSVFRSNSNTLTGSIPISFSVENITGVAHEVEVSINNSSTSTYTDPQTIEQQTNLLLVDRFFKQNSLSFTASSESFEIGYSGLRVIAQNLWFYFNSKDSESKHLRMRGNAEIFSKGGNVKMSLTNTSVNPSRLSLQAVMTNLITTSINYTFTAADKNATGIKVINSTYDALITLPDLNASEIVDGETIYYNNSRLLMVISTNRNCGIAAVTGQTVRGVASINASTNTGWIFIGDKDRLNWLILGVG